MPVLLFVRNIQQYLLRDEVQIRHLFSSTVSPKTVLCLTLTLVINGIWTHRPIPIPCPIALLYLLMGLRALKLDPALLYNLGYIFFRRFKSHMMKLKSAFNWSYYKKQWAARWQLSSVLEVNWPFLEFYFTLETLSIRGLESENGSQSKPSGTELHPPCKGIFSKFVNAE